MKEAIDVAVGWWVERLSESLTKNDAVDKDLNLTMGLFGALKKPLQKEQIDTFAAELRRLLEIEVPKMGARGMDAALDVDYHPSGILAEAAEKARIPDSLYLPCKTHMKVYAHLVKVGWGYAQPFETIYSAAAVKS